MTNKHELQKVGKTHNIKMEYYTNIKKMTFESMLEGAKEHNFLGEDGS